MSTVLTRPTPYKGLVPYAEEDAPFFFGRERDREIISANLLASTLTILYGPSGVGKSSVLRAGVAAHLQEVARERAGAGELPEYVTVVFSIWQDDPVPALLAAVRDAVRQQTGVELALPAPSVDLGSALSGWTNDRGIDLLIILDQFEEYFVYQGAQAAHSRFAVQFAAAANQRNARANWLIGIREDAVAKLDAFKGQIPHLFQNYLRIDHLSRVDARAAILKPIERYNELTAPELPFSAEPALVDAVLDQLQAGRIAISAAGEGRSSAQRSTSGQIEAPYLQLVMTRLWNEESASGSRVLRLETFNEIGGADRIVRTHLDDAIRALPVPAQDTAARVFRFLVTPSGSKIAHSARDLADYAETDESAVEGALRRLSAPDLRIIRPVSPGAEQNGVVRYEIYHDVLAPAVLDWRARYAWKAQLAETARRVHEDVAVEAARGLGLRLDRALIIATVLVTVPFVLQIVNSPDDDSRLAAWLPAVSAGIGLLILIGCGQTFRAIWKSLKNMTRLGFEPLFAAELMVARRTTPVSVLGRAYEAVRLARGRPVKQRLARWALENFALAAPVPMLGLGLALASRGIIRQPGWLSLFVIGPSVLLISCALVLRILHWRRARVVVGDSEGPGTRLDGEGTRPGMSREPRPLPRYTGTLLTAYWLLLVIAGLLCAHVATLPLVGELVWQIVAPSFVADNRFGLGSFAQRFRTTPDPRITPVEAGAALHALESLDTSVKALPGERRLPAVLPYDAELDSAANRVAMLADTIMLHARHGFSDRERARLQRLANHPAADEFARYGRSRAVDYWGAAYEPGFTRQFRTVYELPVWRLKGIRAANYALIARAALAANDGQVAQADSTLRAAVSAGVVLFDNATAQVGSSTALVILKQSLRALGELYEQFDRATEAVPIRAALDAANRAREETSTGATLNLPAAVNARAFRRAALVAIKDSTGVRGLRWELAGLLGVHSCTNLQELVFGSTPEMLEALAKARRELVRFPSEGELFDFITEVPSNVALAPPGVLARAAWELSKADAWILGNPRVAGCAVPVVFF